MNQDKFVEKVLNVFEDSLILHHCLGDNHFTFSSCSVNGSYVDGRWNVYSKFRDISGNGKTLEDAVAELAHNYNVLVGKKENMTLIHEGQYVTIYQLPLGALKLYPTDELRFNFNH